MNNYRLYDTDKYHYAGSGSNLDVRIRLTTRHGRYGYDKLFKLNDGSNIFSFVDSYDAVHVTNDGVKKTIKWETLVNSYDPDKNPDNVRALKSWIVEAYIERYNNETEINTES